MKPTGYLLEKSVYNPQAAFTVTVKNVEISEYPWNPDNVPVVTKTKAKRIPEWQLYGEGGPCLTAPSAI